MLFKKVLKTTKTGGGKRQLKIVFLFGVLVLFLWGCSNPAIVEKIKETQEKEFNENVRDLMQENEIVTREYKREISGRNILDKIKNKNITRAKRGLDVSDDLSGETDLISLEAESQLIDFYDAMPDDLKKGFEKACEDGLAKVQYNFVTTTALNNMSDMTSDFVQTKIAEGEMLSEIDKAFQDEELIVTDESEGENVENILELYNGSGSSRGILKKIVSYKKYENTRSIIGEKDAKMKASQLATIMALLNYKDEVANIASMFDKKIDLKKIEKYHNLINKRVNDLKTRGSSSDNEYYSNYLIKDGEIEGYRSILRNGHIILRTSKVKSKGCIYGTYDHAGIIDLRQYTRTDGYVFATNRDKIVLSAYPKSSKDSLEGDRMPEKLGYPSFEPLKNFTQGEKVVLMEPLQKWTMYGAMDYAARTYNKCNKEYNLFNGSYCSYMPYAGYKSMGVDLNSDPKNVSPTLYPGIVDIAGCLIGLPGLFSGLRALFGTVIVPDDVYNSKDDQYQYEWFQVWVPSGYWAPLLCLYNTGIWWAPFGWTIQWRWVNSGYYVWKYDRRKVFSRSSEIVLERQQ